MEQVAKDIGVQSPNLEEVKEVMRELDVNNDGKLSFSEFQVLIVDLLELMAGISDSK